MQKSVPQELKGVVFDRDVDGEHIGQPARRPKLAATFQAVLELAAGGFHRTRTNRGVAGGQVGILEVVAVVLEVVDFPIDDWIGGIPGQQLLECVDHSMLGVVAELMKKGIDPSGSLFGAIGVKMMAAR